MFIKDLQSPVRTIAENAGGFYDDMLKLLSPYAYVCGTTGQIRDAKEDGVLDPMQVVLNSLESAVSIAALVLLTDVAIIAPSD